MKKLFLTLFLVIKSVATQKRLLMFKFSYILALILLLQACSMSDEKPATMPHVDDSLLHTKTPMRINGHLLPPMPDKTLNVKSVAGVDVNQNGVRDDVERWIYLGYKKAIESKMSPCSMSEAYRLF